MTKLQALFILWLRHEKFNGCSWRALAAHYYNRYDIFTGELIPIEKRSTFTFMTFNGNQIYGMLLENEAFKILRQDPLFIENPSLYQCDLTLINANIKNHIK